MIKAELLAIQIPKLRLTIDIVEETLVEHDPIELYEKNGKILFLFKLVFSVYIEHNQLEVIFNYFQDRVFRGTFQFLDFLIFLFIS